MRSAVSAHAVIVSGGGTTYERRIYTNYSSNLRVAARRLFKEACNFSQYAQ
jgi:hypothetical protein